MTNGDHDMEDFGEILEKLQPGTSWRIFYGKDHPSTRRVHIRAIVDGSQVVCRTWSRRRPGWHYSVHHLYYFYLLDEKGRLIP